MLPCSRSRHRFCPLHLSLFFLLLILTFQQGSCYLSSTSTLSTVCHSFIAQRNTTSLFSNNDVSCDATSKMELLERRLRDIGASEYKFVRVDDCLDEDDEKKECSPMTASNEASDAAPVHVKTLIWEAVFVIPCSSGSGRIIEEVVDHHFVTALPVEDRVDLQRLYALVKEYTLSSSSASISSRSSTNKQAGRLLLRLAKREVAEELTGYQTGTIPPIAHTTPMPLYIDEIVARIGNSSVASVGSGAMGHDLHIPIKEIIRIAELSSIAHINDLSLNKKGSKQDSQTTQGGDDMQKTEEANNGSVDFRSTSIVPPIVETQMANTKGKAARANLLRKAAKKRGNVEVLRQMIAEIGDEFPALMQVEDYGIGGIDKNALHLAAWKGELESVTLLVEAGKAFGLDLVNTISVGEGNYGKTPIFYSLTQCREDAVLLLVASGADLLIVNNKGQTPCSIAVSHLKPEICQLLYDIEASQLQAGGTFKNYRSTHSDGKRYGDLDPRFDIDQDNMGEDILSELEAYNQLLNDTTDRNAEGSSSDERYKLLQSTTIPGLRRSIRETTRHWNVPKKQKQWNGQDTIEKLTKANRDGRLEQLSKRERSLQKMAASEPAVDNVDYDSLEKLTVESSIFNNNLRVKVVDDAAGIAELSEVIDKSVAAAAAHSRSAPEMEISDADIIENSWGLDCEWQPSHTKGYETPVATLQLHHASTATSFLVDVQSLLQSSIADTNAPMTDIEHMLSQALEKIFCNQHIAVLGFGVAMDLGKLAASFPHMPCFRRFENVIDLHTVSRNVYAGSPKTYMSSLQKMAAVLLGKCLDKQEQCSDWEQRPLTSSQVCYACLDAATLPTLLQKMLCGDSVVDRYDGMFIHKHPHLRSTTKLTCLGACGDEAQNEYACAPQVAYRVPYGSCKIHLQHIMARQIWMTGKADPDLPKLLPIEAQQSIALSRRPNKRQSTKKKDVAQAQKKQKKKTLKLSKVSGDFDNLPTPGTIIGYTKDSCIHKLLGKKFMDSLNESDHRLGFNRRGGVLDFANGYCLFVNFALSESGGLPSHWLYRNDFLENGRKLTFTVNCERDQEKALMEFFALHKKSSHSMKVLLFARASSRAKFMYCGECSCANKTDSENYTNLILELMDYDNLATEATENEPSAFMSMVASHAAALAEERALAAEANN